MCIGVIGCLTECIIHLAGVVIGASQGKGQGVGGRGARWQVRQLHRHGVTDSYMTGLYIREVVRVSAHMKGDEFYYNVDNRSSLCGSLRVIFEIRTSPSVPLLFLHDVGISSWVTGLSAHDCPPLH